GSAALDFQRAGIEMSLDAARTSVPIAFRTTMGMKTRGSSGGGEKWGQPTLSTRRKRRSLGQSRQSPFFADSAVFEGACATLCGGLLGQVAAGAGLDG